ncbi:MAG: hypothetical protein AB7V27_09985 [Candidatus Binatia bacterium]
MNEHSTVRLVIAIALAAYGVYAASYIPALLIGEPLLLVIAGFTLQAVLAVAAAVCIWRRSPLAPVLVIALAATMAATALIEGFVLGIRPYLYALFAAVVEIAVALVLAAYLRRTVRLD